MKDSTSTMSTMCFTSHRRPCVSYPISLLLVICIFFTFLSQVALSGELGSLKVEEVDGPSTNLTQIAARVERNNSGSFGFTKVIGETCSKRDILVSEGSIGPLPNGIPAFSVEIVNTCVSCTSIQDIHIRCGQFASATQVNPKLFRRLANDDCLVNDGRKLTPGSTVSFRYANSFSYPLSVASVKCNN